VYFELKIREALGFEFNYNLIGFLLETLNLDETWTRDFYLHLVTNSTLGKEFKV
jgi:hypothetical protein